MGCPWTEVCHQWVLQVVKWWISNCSLSVGAWSGQVNSLRCVWWTYVVANNIRDCSEGVVGEICWRAFPEWEWEGVLMEVWGWCRQQVGYIDDVVQLALLCSCWIHHRVAWGLIYLSLPWATLCSVLLNLGNTHYFSLSLFSHCSLDFYILLTAPCKSYNPEMRFNVLVPSLDWVFVASVPTAVHDLFYSMSYFSHHLQGASLISPCPHRLLQLYWICQSNPCTLYYSLINNDSWLAVVLWRELAGVAWNTKHCCKWI